MWERACVWECVCERERARVCESVCVQESVCLSEWVCVCLCASVCESVWVVCASWGGVCVCYVMRKCTCVSSSTRQERENTKEDILKNVRNKTVFFSYCGSQRFPKTARLQTFFRISSFVFRTNTFIQVWIYLRMMTDFHCWELCPFKVHLMFPGNTHTNENV